MVRPSESQILEDDMGVLAGWGFASFLFFKLSCDFLFDKNLSIIAAAIAAIITVVIIFATMPIYGEQHGRSLAKNTFGTASPYDFIKKLYGCQ